MDIPFISSGALSRAHYSLVRKVEELTSEGSVNQILEAEVKSIREQLTRPNLLLRRSKEALVVLLYCSMTATASIFPQGTFDFALFHALNLAEAGPSVEDKRIGYLFCAEMMHPLHEMRLMLVNTLRKDLEHDSVARICLALDSVIHSPFAEIIPAIQRRLHDLLSHNHSSVRRRTLYAIRSLSKHEPELLEQTRLQVIKRLNDPDAAVVGAALRIVAAMSSTTPESASVLRDAVNDVFEGCVHVYSPTKRGSMLASLEVVRGVGLRTLSLPSAFDLAASCSSGNDSVVIIELYRSFKKIDLTALRAVEEQTQISLIGTIRKYLTSRISNDNYLFLVCLESVDSGLWAGTSEAIPAVLEGWEVEQIMQLLDSYDDFIRRKTLQLLCQVDGDILNTYYTRAISITTQIALPFKELNQRTKRLLEVLEVISADDGELYGGQVERLLSQMESHTAENGILDSAIGGVLSHIRVGEPSFQMCCAATMLVTLCDVDATIGPTMMIILASLAAEFFRLVSFSPLNLLSGICHRLKANPPSVQEPSLLAMLIISADCETIPNEVTQTVSEVVRSAGRHVRYRCEQFLTLSSQRDILLGVINGSRTLTLPDFVEALEIHRGSIRLGDHRIPGAKFPQDPPALSQTISPGVAASQLRYEAYDVPHAIPSLRVGRLKTSQDNMVGSHSNQGPVIRPNSPESSTTAPIQATLFGEMGVPENAQAMSDSTAKPDVEDLSLHLDLIAFDSPFVKDIAQTESAGKQSVQQELNFESAWNTYEDPQQGTRGWCDAPLDEAIGRLQGIDRHRIQVTPANTSPFIGDLKVVVLPDEGDDPDEMALLRLKGSDEDTCLWRLRCSDVLLRDRVKRILGSQ